MTLMIIINRIMEQVERVSWRFCGHKFSRSQVVYFSQILILYMIIITCIVNLSIKNGDSNLWTALLSSSIGYILPSPKLKNIKRGEIISSENSSA